jgi:hypothetical protein
MIGLGGIAPGAKTATPVLDPEVAKEKFAQLYALKTLSCKIADFVQTWE